MRCVADAAFDADRTSAPGAGGKVSASRMSGDDVDLAEALQPGERQQRRIDLTFVAACAAACRPGRGRLMTLISGRMRRISAWRRSEAEPTVAPCGSSISFGAVRPMTASRMSSRGRKAERCRPSGSLVGMSLDGVHGEVEVAAGQSCVLHLLGEEALAADLRRASGR